MWSFWPSILPASDGQDCLCCKNVVVSKFHLFSWKISLLDLVHVENRLKRVLVSVLNLVSVTDQLCLKNKQLYLLRILLQEFGIRAVRPTTEHIVKFNSVKKQNKAKKRGQNWARLQQTDNEFDFGCSKS